MDEKVRLAIERVKTWDELQTVQGRLRERHLFSPEVDAELHRRGMQFGREYVLGRVKRTDLDLTEAETRIVDVVGEYWALQRRKGKAIEGTFKQIRNHGLLGAAEEAVSGRHQTSGFHELTEAGLEELSYEQIVFDYPSVFSPRATWFARRTLGHPNASSQPPASDESLIQSRTETLLNWFLERISPETGIIAIFKNDEAAAALGMDLSRYGRVYGNIQSRIDFACFRADLPALGLIAERKFPDAWKTTNCDWDFPTVQMQKRAQSHAWTAENLIRIRNEAAALPGQSYIVWQETMTDDSESIRSWAFTAEAKDSVQPDVSGSDWTDEELRAAVAAYLEMLAHSELGTPLIKKHYYERLSKTYGRTVKAFEFRMQNISYVRELMGLSWLAGLRPAQHVGAETAQRIEGLIDELEGREPTGRAAFEAQVADQREKMEKEPRTPEGNGKPGSSKVSVTKYNRDYRVAAWILENAKGICECCDQPAPFETSSGPFLEVHHVRRLADRGGDTTCNAVAICPNCHRRLHYSVDATKAIEALYQKIPRLVKRSRPVVFVLTDLGIS